MRPNLLHAVFTAEDSLTAGGFNYIEVMLPYSLDAISAQVRGQVPDNDSISADDFAQLISLAKSLPTTEFSSEALKSRIIANLRQMLLDLGIRAVEEGTTKSRLEYKSDANKLMKPNVSKATEKMPFGPKIPELSRATWVSVLSRTSDKEQDRTGTYFNGLYLLGQALDKAFVALEASKQNTAMD